MLNIIITGSTGMVGEGVLDECLKHPDVESVLVINRKPCNINHHKLHEIIHKDFFDVTSIEDQLTGYNTCFFCLGVSSVGLKASEYFNKTYTLTMNIAETVSRLNKNMIFEYISGAGTDSSEKGRVRWARVKGKTENDLMKLPFRRVYVLRPGFIKPKPGMTRTHKIYKYISWLFPIGRALVPSGFCTLTELSLSMLYMATKGYEKNIIDGKDIIMLASRNFK